MCIYIHMYVYIYVYIYIYIYTHTHIHSRRHSFVERNSKNCKGITYVKISVI